MSWETIAELWEAFSQTFSLSGKELVEARLRIITIALKGKATEDQLRALPTDVVDIYDAVEAINDMLGYGRLGELMMARMKESSAKAGTISSPMPAPSPDGTDPKSAE